MFTNRLRVSLILCLVFFFAGVAYAEEAAKPLFKIGGDMRLRSETLAHFDSFVAGRTAVNNDSFILMRLRPYAESNPTDQIRLFVQPQFSRSFAQEESTLANGLNIDDLDLHQGYVDFTGLANRRLAVRVGRQELNYGDERLVGALGWSNVGRAFDGAKISLGMDKGWVDSFGSWIQSAGGNQYLSGLHGHWDAADPLAVEPYFLVLRDNDGGLGGGALTVYTLGDRLAGTHEKWDYGLEAALQLGSSGGNDIVAYAGHVQGGYTFDAGWKPRLSLEYNLASGDSSPTSGTVKTFNNLFPTNHDKYGYMDLVGLRNINDPELSLQLVPVTPLTLTLASHAFILMNPEDGLYQASGTQVRAGAAGASRYVGAEVDSSLAYKWNKYANFLLGYSFFKAGSFLSDTGVEKDAHFIYAQTQVKFDAILK